jgi:non-haem Fe2+, alpha-ketoglutarate-dependent halogenase
MIGLLTPAQRSSYDIDGLTFPLRVLTTAEAFSFRQACDELELRLGGKPRTIQVRQMHLHFPWAFALATHPPLIDVIADLLGPNLLIWATELFAKHAHDANVAIGWHRDRPYMGIEGRAVATAWVALSDSTLANGCMCGLPLSREKLGATTAPTADDQDVVAVELRAGEMSLHNPDIYHGSQPNLSGEKRVGFVIRYVTPEVKPLAGRPPVVLARGTAGNGPFDLVGPPSAQDERLALAAMKQSALQHFDAVLQNLKRARP